MDPGHWFPVVLDACICTSHCFLHFPPQKRLPEHLLPHPPTPYPPAKGPQAHPTPAPSETLTYPQELISHPPSLPWVLASAGSPVAGVWGWVHPLRTLCFGNISLALGASGFFKPETVLLERLFRRWSKARFCSCVLGSRHAQKASSVLPHLDLTPRQPAEQGSFRLKHEAFREMRQAPGHPVRRRLISTLNVGLRAFHPIWYLLQICRNVAALSINSRLSSFLKLNSLIQTVKYCYILIIY